MDGPSKQLADRYHLRLAPSWAAWFDSDWGAIEPAGTVCDALSCEQLCEDAPAQIWPGFMPPDTLPIIGNAYGDWICVRVEPNDDLGELIYWCHGGGDWIPVGSCLAEALLHDAVDQFRPIHTQMLRGATETRDESEQEVLARLLAPPFHAWLCKQLSTESLSESSVAEVLQTLASQLQAGQHTEAVKLLYDHRWAQDAAACDLIEEALQGALQRIAQSDIAKAVGLTWYPDYVQLMFDSTDVSEALRTEILEAAGASFDQWPVQNWQRASKIADEVLTRRDDLGWAVTIAGWSRERVGDQVTAAEIFWRGRRASSFADQSVRFNSHSAADEYGKFSIARLAVLRKHLPPGDRTDPYMALFTGSRSTSLLTELHDYWFRMGDKYRRAGRFDRAYDCFYRAGWDLGVSRLSDYRQILHSLADAAREARWPARAAVADVHLRCLEKRMR